MDIRWRRRRQFCIKCCPKGTENWRDVPSGTEWGKTFLGPIHSPNHLKPDNSHSPKNVCFSSFPFHFLVLLPSLLSAFQAPSMVPRIDGLVGWLVRRDLLGPSHYGCNPFMPRGRPPPSLLFLTFCAEHNSAVRQKIHRGHGTAHIGPKRPTKQPSNSQSVLAAPLPHFQKKREGI